MTIRENGYDYAIDAHARPRRINGELKLQQQPRSRGAQANAGKPDRRNTDGGGHYIATRFNGPRKWFNHFAQDSNFNRGVYRTLEDQWANAIRSNKRVFVDIVPHYRGVSMRPHKWISFGLSMANASSEDSSMNDRGSEMASDKYSLLGPLFADVGGEIAEIVGGSPDGVFLYSEAGDGWVGAGIFKDEGETVRYFDPSSELIDLLLKAWRSQDPDKRWAVMEYEIRGTKFDANFQFPEEIDPEESEMERRPRALKQHFGDKPVIYPPLPPHLTQE